MTAPSPPPAGPATAPHPLTPTNLAAAPLTPSAVLAALSPAEPSAPLIFRTAKGEIFGGYHVTELKLADIRSIDCLARQSQWREATLQLLDGRGGDPMTVGRFRRILEQSARGLDGLSEAPLQVEFAHGNDGVRLYSMQVPALEAERVVIDLADLRAQCKPAEEAAAAARRNGDAGRRPCCG